MKIGILTYHDAHNYGAVLQAYALKTYLNKQGHDATLVNYHHKDVPDGFPRERKMKKCETKEELDIFLKEMEYSAKDHDERWIKFDSFIKQLIDNNSYVYDSEEELEKIQDIDVFICGSDQIWNSDITGELNKGFFLYFNTKAKKISYAASMGIDALREDEEADFKKYINNLDSIGVREDSLKEYSEKFTDKKVTKTLDPTFLLEKKDYEDLLTEVKFEKYILIYALGPDSRLTKLANYIAKEKNLKIVELNDCKKENYQFEQVSNAGPSDFLSLIYNADFVITNSFHGTIFSIIFNKEFYTLTRLNRNSRMKSLLGNIGLGDRLLDQNIDIDINKTINFKDAEKLLEKDVEIAKTYLKESI